MKRLAVRIMGITVCFVLLLFAIVWNLPRPQFEMEQIRPQFWHYPNLSSASYQISQTERKQISIHLEHPILKNVTPMMLSWWYKNLATGVHTIDGTQYPFYQLFHLSEHGQTKIIQPATDGKVGMGVGSVMYRQEKFGPYFSKGQGRVTRFDENGFTVIPILGPLTFGAIDHRFEKVSEGTRYTVDIQLGSDLPVLGGLLTYYIREKLFPPDLIQEWIRHQVEEVGSLPHFLPALYSNRPPES